MSKICYFTEKLVNPAKIYVSKLKPRNIYEKAMNDFFVQVDWVDVWACR